MQIGVASGVIFSGQARAGVETSKNFVATTSDALSSVLSQFVENNQRLIAMVSRSYGPEPEAGKPENAPKAIMQGHVGTVEAQIAELFGQIDIQRGLISRLENVI